MRAYLILLLLLLLTGTAGAQKTGEKLRFRSFSTLGLIVGDGRQSLMIQSVNGLQRQSVFAGVGVAADFYDLRSIPLFLDLRYLFPGNEGSAFLFADAGANLVKQHLFTSPWGSISHKDGFYYDLGAGYVFRIGRRERLIMTASYGAKKYSIVEQYDPNCVRCGGFRDVDRFSSSRVIIRAGVALP